MGSPMFTILLNDGSYYIDAATRDQLLLACSAGADSVRISVANQFDCSSAHSAVVRPAEIVAFISHSELSIPIARESNVIPIGLRA
jgi:hypothetical protein